MNKCLGSRRSKFGEEKKNWGNSFSLLKVIQICFLLKTNLETQLCLETKFSLKYSTHSIRNFNPKVLTSSLIIIWGKGFISYDRIYKRRLILTYRYYLGNPSRALSRLLIVTPAVYPHLNDFTAKLNFRHWSRPTQLRTLKPS